MDPTDPNFSDRIRELMDEEEVDDPSSDSSAVDDSDADPDFVPSDGERSNASGISSSGDEDDDPLELGGEEEYEVVNVVGREEIFYVERTKKSEKSCPNAWSSKAPPRRVRTPARNIIRALPGLKGQARTLGNQPTKKQVWDLLFDQTIVNTIVTQTNVKLQKVRESLSANTKKTNYRNTDIEEINALIGLLLASSILSSNDEKITSLFTKDAYSRPIYSATMSEKRLEILLMCLRFDDSTTRMQRKESDKAAPVSEIFEKFISNSQSVYSVSSEVTVDEMLVPFRGRCSFRVFMPNKPKKYGIKIICLCDAKTSYLSNAYIYTGKGSDSVTLSDQEKKLSIPTQAVVRVCRPIVGSNRNVTADNWFTSIEVVDELEKRQLTYIGTVRKDKKMIPNEFLQSPDRPVMSALYGFRGQFTLLSFVPKYNKAVVLISSMHHSVATNQEKRKPEIIADYNKTKCGVDVLDMRCAIYTSNRRTRRWPLAIFYRMLNIGTVNAFILFMSFRNSPIMTRFKFIKELAEELIVPHLQKRVSNPCLQRDLKELIKKTLGDKMPPVHEEAVAEVGVAEPSGRLNKRKTCASCPSALRRKTAYTCISCQKPICLDFQCSKKICAECIKDVVK